MAFSATRKDVNIEGNKTVEYYDLDFDSVTEGEIETGLVNIAHADYSPNTSDKHGIIYLNYSDAGVTPKQGSIYITSVTADDEGSLRVVG